MKSNLGCLDIFLVVLTAVFVALKLAGVIAWSWGWVLSPIWIGLLLIAVIILGLLALAKIASL